MTSNTHKTTITMTALPSNLLLAVNEEIDYVFAETGDGETLILAEALLAEVMAAPTLGASAPGAPPSLAFEKLATPTGPLSV